MGKVHFILGIHNHQPTGNFHHVFQWAYDHAYRPFLDVLKDYPAIKISIHHSGPLLDWLQQYHPDYIEDYRHLAKDGRVEIMGGAYYEPILPIIPDEDKYGQLQLMKEKLRDMFHYDAVGVWVPERVWEPYLPRFINRTGYKYVVLDDVHFLYAGLKEDDLTWMYITEDSGYPVIAFPDLQTLRYMIPFHTVEAIERYFRSFAEREDDVILVMADDGEKFGVWPGTFKHVYEDKWLMDFFNMLSRISDEDWFDMLTFEEAVSKFQPRGRVYIPTASYIEMTEWVLPTDMQKDFEKLVKEYPQWKPYLRGGHWRMFFSKYYESNLMKSRMLEASRVVSQLEDAQLKSKAKEYLYRGQTNCAYWHGVFGGLYLPHLRRAIYENLIKAESIAVQKHLEIKEIDFDADGSDEILIRTDRFFAVMDREHGGIIEFDDYSVPANLINVMGRYPEAYHEKVYQAISPDEVDGTKTIHEVVLAKEKNLSDYLIYDKYHYKAFLDFVKGEGNYTVEDFYKGHVENPYIYKESYIDGENIGVCFTSEVGSKCIHVLPDGIKASYEMKEPIFAIIPIAFYDPSIQLNVDGINHAVSSIRELHVSHLSVHIPFMNVEHVISTSGHIIGFYPIYTVSNSEAGFEKVYQGTVFVVRIDKGYIKWGVHVQ